jgi:hypothetical protein
MAGVERLTVLLAEADHARLSQYCDEHGCKKSTLVAKLVKNYLDSVFEPGAVGVSACASGEVTKRSPTYRIHT